MRKFKFTATLATCLVLLASNVAAHTAITATSIPNGGTIAASPPAYTVTYGAPVRLASVTLVNGAGQNMPLAFARGGADTSFAVPFPHLGAGSYTMTFRAMGGDGHVMNNQTTFSIGPPSAAIAPKAVPKGPMGGMAGMNHSGHTMTVTTSIADGAVLATSPRTINVQFPHPMALTSARLTTASGERVAIQIPSTRSLVTSVTVPLPRLDADSYTFTWGADAGDHNMSGTVRFSIR